MPIKKDAARRRAAGRQPHVTEHAMQRAIERHQCRSAAEANRHLTRCWQQSVRLPPRYARDLFNRPVHSKPQAAQKRDFRIAGSTLLVCRGRHILTTWRLTESQLATVVVWILSHCWES
jgi:hypothetical protein